MEQAILHLQPLHQRVKNDQAGKGGQVLFFKFQVGNFIGSTHYFASAILHRRWPPATGILVHVQSYFTNAEATFQLFIELLTALFLHLLGIFNTKGDQIFYNGTFH